MVARFLVTTALETTWPSEDVPVLFLGEWCRRYDRKSAWKLRDAFVAPYHWDDRQKLFSDYQYLQCLYEQILKDVVDKLNDFHDVQHSIRYWRIVIGPWLGYFIQMLFDRWAMLTRVLKNGNISGVRVLKYKNTNNLVPNSMGEFTSMFTDDAWNESIYSQILDQMGVTVEKIDASYDASKCRDRMNKPAQVFKNIAGKVASFLSGALCRDTEYFFISSYLPLKYDLLLQAKLGQIPKLWRPISNLKYGVINDLNRQWQISTSNCNDEFAHLSRALIPKNIPIAYLEGYKNLVSLAENVPWPKTPKAIFTSNSYSGDEVFKIWAAKKVEDGTPLIIGQHGGVYGISKFCFTEEHQLKIADKFLTWGWKDSAGNKTKPVGIIKLFGRIKSRNKNAKGALIVGMAASRYSYHLYSAPVAAGDLNGYFQDQFRFIDALPRYLQQEITVRLYRPDYGLAQKSRWRNRYPDIAIDPGIEAMEDVLNKTKLCITTYNATTFLESLISNVPTIMFWNPNHWELRADAQPYFDLLKKVGIFHERPEGAAIKMTEVWDDIDSWWFDSETQRAREFFCKQYSDLPKNPLEKMVSEINLNY